MQPAGWESQGQGRLARSCQGQERQRPPSPASPHTVWGQAPALAADLGVPFHPHGSREQPSEQRRVRAPAASRASGGHLCAPLTRVSFRRSLPRPAAEGRQREGAPALAGRAHGAAAFPFSSQRKCFGRQIIPGDMKLLRPPHVARKKNRNEHLWRLLWIPGVS